MSDPTSLESEVSRNKDQLTLSPTPHYYELSATSNFSFLNGASHPEELIAQAAELGMQGLAITDTNSFAGIVRAYKISRDYPSFNYLVGMRLELQFAPEIPTGNEYEILPLLVYPTNRTSYGNLCELLSIGKQRCKKGFCQLFISDFLLLQEGVVGIFIPPCQTPSEAVTPHNQQINFLRAAETLLAGVTCRERYSLALARFYGNNSKQSDAVTSEAARQLKLPLVATNHVHYHHPSRKPLHDVLCCIRRKTTISRAGFALQQNAERYLKAPAEMARLFRDLPQAIRRTAEIASWIKNFSLAELRYEYPHEVCPEGISPLHHLRNLTQQGAAERFPQGVPAKVVASLEEEFKLIEELSYEKYFLTCHDIVRYARSVGILCQGRGAAANSAVCYCLGITSVDPARIDLLFARFVSKERNEPPDIDIDFEHERREEVIQYIYKKYGRSRAGLTSTVTTYRSRSAIREVGKALGLSLEIISKLTSAIHRWTGNTISSEDLREIGLNPEDSTLKNCFCLAQELRTFPRHLGQHVGGFIISAEPLLRTVPILNASMPDRTIIEWDKDDIETLGMLKIDILGLGILSCIRKTLALINCRPEYQKAQLEFHTIPAEDPQVYDMICAADTIGVFQIESRAQMSMLPRLLPRRFYDLVIEVAIVRPGPIQGNMVHPYLKRRNGLEKMEYPDERVRDILGKTLGVPLFQEQAMRLVIILAGFTPGEAEMLRRSMASWKRNKNAVATFETRIIAGMKKNNFSEEFAQTCVNQIKGFGEYGFPESHAASFALLVYVSAWLKYYYPTEFAAALINSQPMGFYSVSQILQDAQQHRVQVTPVDVNNSEWDCTLEEVAENQQAAPDLEQKYDSKISQAFSTSSKKNTYALRLGMCLVKGIHESDALHLQATVKTYGPFKNIPDLWQASHTFSQRAPLRKVTLLSLARADGFSSMELSQREALWQIHALAPHPTPLATGEPQRPDLQACLPKLSPQKSMFADFKHTGFSLKAHPLQFVRDTLTKRGVFTAAALRKRFPKPKTPLGKTEQKIWVSVAGLVTVRQRPGTAKGTVFLSLEDETGMVNLIISSAVFDRYQKLVIMSVSLQAYGRLEQVGNVLYVSVSCLESLDELVLSEAPEGIELPCLSYSY